MTDRDRDVRERCAEIADSFAGQPVEIKHPQDWALHGERMSAIRIANKIRALDLPRTSARTSFDLAAYVTVEPIGGNFGVYVNPSADHPYVWSFREKFQADQLADAIRKALSRSAKPTLTSAREVTDAEIEIRAAAFADAEARDGKTFPWAKCSEDLKRDYRRYMRAALASAPQPACVVCGGNDGDLSSEAFVRKMRDEDWPDRQQSLSPAPSPQAGGEDELRQKIVAFDAFLNEPQLDIEPITLRDYRHQAFREWTALRDGMLSTLSARREG